MASNLYFAYGSNLNQADWHEWCRRNNHSTDLLRFHSIGYLPDHDLAFRYKSSSRDGGVLDVVPRVGQAVPGVIFEVLSGGWEALDAKEGAPDIYEKFGAVAIDSVGEEVPVRTYRVCSDRVQPFVRPNPKYVDVVKNGLDKYDLGDSLVSAAAKNEETPFLVDALFTYGTLMRGESRFSLLRRYGLICSLLAEISGRLLDLGSFPGLVKPNRPDDFVKGDFIRVHNIGDAIDELDRIEGFRGFGQPESLYRRTLNKVAVGDGRIRTAWVYHLNTNAKTGSEIESGDWRSRQQVSDGFLKSLVAAHVIDNEKATAARIAQMHPFCFDTDLEFVTQSLLPLESAIRRGKVSERRLAQASGHWLALCSD